MSVFIFLEIYLKVGEMGIETAIYGFTAHMLRSA